MPSTAAGAEFVALCITAATVGVLHTLLGPDHYVPFVAMARAGGWSATKTLRVTAVCGLGHVAGSVAIGIVGLGVGTAVLSLEAVEGIRGDLCAWLLMAFGGGYLVWGLRRAAGGAVRSEPHLHAAGLIHAHGVATRPLAGGGMRSPFDTSGRATEWTPWMLFVLFVFGPCEPLIPLLLVPAVKASPIAVAGVVAAFAAATVSTMTLAVLAIRSGISMLHVPLLDRYTHALAGFAVLLCGMAVKFGL